MKNKIKTQVQTYEEPEIDGDGKLVKKIKEENKDGEDGEAEDDDLTELKK